MRTVDKGKIKGRMSRPYFYACILFDFFKLYFIKSCHTSCHTLLTTSCKPLIIRYHFLVKSMTRKTEKPCIYAALSRFI